MHRFARATRTLAPLAAGFLILGLSGCHWFGKSGDLYTQSPESRPLEVPPDLDRPSADRAMALPNVGTASSVTASGVPVTATPIGFNVAADRDTVFGKIGDALATVPGVRIASKAEILGTYDVDYMDSKFLVRVTRAGSGTWVSAVDPRGLPPTGEAAGKLIATLKTALGGQ